MRSLVSLLIVLGTTAIAQAEGPFPPGWPGLSATTKAGARVSLRPDGPWLPKPAPAGTSLEVHDDAGANPRFEEEVWTENGNGVALALYAERTGLQTVTLAGAMVVPSPGGAAGPRAPHYQPSPGTHVVERARKDGHVEVAIKHVWEGGGFEVRGFVPDAFVGTVYRYSYPRRGVAPYNPDITLPSTVELAGAPGAARFATIRNSGRISAMKLATRGKHTLVRTPHGIVGWVRSAEVKRPRRDRGGGGDGVEGGVEGGVAGGALQEGRLRAGMLFQDASLHDAPGGTVVGVVRSEVYWGKPIETKGVWGRFEIATRFGAVSVWAKPATEADITAARQASKAPSPPRTKPLMVRVHDLEQQRTAGALAIEPDAGSVQAMTADGTTKVVGVVSMCIGPTGAPASVTIEKSTGYPAFDGTIEQAVWKWRYKPWIVDGVPREVCTAVLVNYPPYRSKP